MQKNKKYFVDDAHRTNHLSKTPGGSTVGVIDINGTRKYYDKIKYPEKFIRKALQNGAREAWKEN